MGRETHSIAAEKRGVDWHSMRNAFRRPRFLLLLQRYDYSKVIDYSSYSKKKRTSDVILIEIEILEFVKTSGETKQDVLFGDMLWLEILKTCGCDNVGKNTTSGGVPPKGGVGEFPPSERLLRNVKSKRKAKKKKTLWKTKNQKQPFLLRCLKFLLRRNF